MEPADQKRNASLPPSRQGDPGAERQPAKICLGLRSAAVGSGACESFQVLCRVVGGTFSHVSAGTLFELRVSAPDARAVRLFDSLVGPEARLFEQGVGLQLQLSGAMCNDFGDVAMADATLAKSLVAETKKIDATLGGLYQGRLDLIFGRRSAIQSWAWTRVAAARAAPARRRGTQPRRQAATARRRARRASRAASRRCSSTCPTPGVGQSRRRSSGRRIRIRAFICEFLCYM